NPVYPKTIGAYTVTYEVADSAGNKVTASRMVQVRARDAGGGGGGAFGVGFVLAGLLTAAWRRAGRGARQAARRTLRLGSPPRRPSSVASCARREVRTRAQHDDFAALDELF